MRTRTMFATLIIMQAMVLFCLVSNVRGETRTWTSTSGQKITASLKEISGDNKTVVLVNEQGQDVKIPRDQLSADDAGYIILHQLEKADKPVLVYQGTNITFSIAKDGVLHLDGTGLKTVWPDGRPPQKGINRRTLKPIPLAPHEKKRSMVVKDEVHWTNLELGKLIEIIETAITRTEDVIKTKVSVESWKIYDKTELVNGRPGGVAFSFRSQAGLEGVSAVKAKMMAKQGSLAVLIMRVLNSDGSVNSDLTELSEEFSLEQQKALLRALNGIPKDKLGGQE